MGFFDNIFHKKETKQETLKNWLNDSVDPFIIEMAHKIGNGQKLDDESFEKMKSIMASNPRLYREMWTKLFGSNAYATKEEQEKWLGNKENLTKKDLIEDLTNLENNFNSYAFRIVKDIIVKDFNDHSKEIIEHLKTSDTTIREFVLNYIVNTSGDLLESGHYHFYRGALDLNGTEILKFFDKGLDMLLTMKAKNVDEEYVKNQKEVIRNNIKYIG